MTVEIIEVVRRSTQGMTRPYICRGDDGHVYFVKGVGAGRRSQLCEWIAGCLARETGLPVAPFEIVYVPEELLELDSALDLEDLGAGPAFGSRECGVSELSYSRVEDVPSELQQQVLAFDWWIRNEDRILTDKGGNPNLFWDEAAGELVVIDHNQAFDPVFDPEEFMVNHVFRAQAAAIQQDLLRRHELADAMIAALQRWEWILEQVPEEWWYLDEEMIAKVDFDSERIRKGLARASFNEFWRW
jgi:PAS domain-containing protein